MTAHDRRIEKFGPGYSLLGAMAALAASFYSVPCFAQEPYSPAARGSYPDTVYWGDTHVHTALSGDAFAMGTRLMPDDAYRFAKGDTIRATGGEEVRLRRPLDFLMVADHAENLGVIPRIAAGHASVPVTEQSKRWAQIFAQLIPLRDVLNAENAEAFDRGYKLVMSAKASWQGDYAIDEQFKRSVWNDVIANAERHNDPGKFTTFIGYEWSGRDSGRMIHRNVLFEGGRDETSQTLPYSRFDSDDPEDLWKHLEDYEDQTEGKVISIPHNGNLSGGTMFALRTFDGSPLTQDYAKTRSRWEPIFEVTQIKGDGEAHPLISPTDEFADYETWPARDKASPQLEERKRSSYARSALNLGLDRQASLGTNPFKFGMIGSTDSHTALATADENSFWGKMGLNEPSPYRAITQAIFASTGYAAIWAEENTRASLFAAMKRREVYATTGPRITVRFFGGWGYAETDATSPALATIGYDRGVPMGGDLTSAPGDEAPSFLIRAVKDPDGANLDRVQVIKGWRDEAGETHEKIYNVALSDGREEDRNGNVEPVGSTVNISDASYTNSIGDPEFAVVWTDPDFDKDELAFYYVRVLEIPTPRWTAYDAKFYGLEDLPEEIPMVTQERAYTSPIWYTP